MLKRILSGVLVAAIALTSLPMTAFAQTNNILYGDVNADGEIDLNDALMLKRYIAEEEPSGFQFKNADVNADKTVDMTDLLMLKKRLAEWDIHFGSDQYAVSFYDGDRLIETLFADQGEPLGKTPSVEKTSKAGGIFVGWYADHDCTIPFYSENPVNSDTSVYAKYDAAKGIEEVLIVDSFAKTDVGTNYAFTVKGEGDALAALTLIAKDGSEAPVLQATDNGNGTYTVIADGGFRAGSSYELELAEGFYFVGDNGDLPETVRTAYFTVKKEIVDTLKIKEDIRNIKDTADIRYSRIDSDGDNQYDDTVDELDSNMGISPDGSVAAVAGAGSMGLAVGDIICFYVGTDPKDRVYTGEGASAYVGEPTTYVKIKEISENEIVFTALAEDDLNQVYDIPDVFPLKDKAENNKTNISNLDISVYSLYGIETPTIDFAKTKIAVGDYVAVYENTPQNDDQSGITFGEITAYDEGTGEIAFRTCTAEAITSSRSMYVQPAIAGDRLITEEEKNEIEATMFAQIKESGFAEEAAYALANLSTKTDGFKNMSNLRSILLGDGSGKPLTENEIELLSESASFELKNGVKLSVELITKGDELHYKNGVQLAVNIEAEFEVDAEEGKVVIQLDAAFIEELSIRPTVDGDLTYTHILGIPIPNGVRISANIDVLNYTAYDFDVTAYTVGEKDKALWQQLKGLAKNPTTLTTVLGESGLIPAKYADQLTKVSDVFKKIEEVEKKISDAKTKYDEGKEKVEELTSDLKDLENLAEALFDKGACGKLTKEDWKNAAQTFSKTNIARELLHLSDDGIRLDGDDDAQSDVNIKSVDELMAKYSEMLEKETDWVKLLDKTICEANAGIYVVNLSLKVDFIIRTNMSIALGSTLEYETGKRYIFWFKFGLYKPTGGSSTMDLIDESLAFQFYVMGKLEIKMGAKITIGANIGSSDVASVGIYAEVGPYVKLYGFFVYTFERMREANTLTSVKKEQKMGALFLETGIYLIVGIEASAVKGFFEVSYDFMDKEFPILKAGSNEYPYEFSSKLQEDEKIIVRDSDGDSSTGITMVLPEQLRAVRTMTLTTGKSKTKIFDYSFYNISFSNPNFSLNQETGEIVVHVPDGMRYMDCEMRMIYKYGKMAFSNYDIGISIPLYWTNLSAEELKECYTASVRVGNAQDGYQTVWSKRVLKNTSFELPTEDEIKKLIGYNDLKYTGGGYASAYDTTGGIIEDKVYDFNVTAREYSLTVNGIEGGNSAQTFFAKYGEPFDFSALAATGKNDAVNGEYTRFLRVTTDSTICVGKDGSGNDLYETINLDSPISERMAQALLAGEVTATASYVDNSVTATFVFQGLLKHTAAEQVLPKGSAANFAAVEAIVAENGLAITDITPSIGAMYAHTVYIVTAGELEGESYTISFEENGGSDVSDITRIGGSVIGVLPTPTMTGYTFDGWYTDAELENEFKETLVPRENITLYAKWTGNAYTVSFHVNGGTGETPPDMTVFYNGTYGVLPEAQRTGYGFAGWFTAAEGGTQINADTRVELTADQTLYAHWDELKEIPREVFSFTKPANRVYQKDTEHGDAIQMTYTPEDGAEYDFSEFTVEYMLEDGTGGYVSAPKNAGTYLARVSRPAKGLYAKFEQTYAGVLTIEKATFAVPEDGYQIIYTGHSAGEHATQKPASLSTLEIAITGLPDEDLAVLKDCEKFEFQLYWHGAGDNYVRARSHDGYFSDVQTGKEFDVKVSVRDDPNYTNVFTNAYIMYDGQRYDTLTTRNPSKWTKHTSSLTLGNSITVSSAAQLAYIAAQVNKGNSLYGKTILLANDIDLYRYEWVPIGTEEYPFAGTFDGQGYTISNLFGSGGLFGYCKDQTVIKNVTVADSVVCALNNAGGIVGRIDRINTHATNAAVFGCTVSNININGNARIGGIIGYAEYTDVSDCQAASDVEIRGGYIGGIAGEATEVTITGCSVDAKINGSFYVGGVVGSAGKGSISNTVCSAAVSAYKYGGEFVAQYQYGNEWFLISDDCLFNGTLTVTEQD